MKGKKYGNVKKKEVQNRSIFMSGEMHFSLINVWMTMAAVNHGREIWDGLLWVLASNKEGRLMKWMKEGQVETVEDKIEK